MRGGYIMCLSAVYVDKREDQAAIVQEASVVQMSGEGSVLVDTLFGEKKTMKGYRIREVNFLKNYLILEKGD
jgi:hypothetical protein